MKKAFGIGVVAPRDATEYFQNKHMLLPSYRWSDVYGAEHSSGIAVAGITKANILQIYADAIQKAIDNGGDYREAKKGLIQELIKQGYWGDVTVTDPETGKTRISRFDSRRLDLIFQTNTRAAFAAGQYARAQEAKGALPFFVYLTMGDDHVRPLHEGWNGTCLPVDHPFWLTHMPPNGWGCRCAVIQANERIIARLMASGVPIKRHQPGNADMTRRWVNPATGEVLQVPVGIDPGFEYNPGLARLRGILPHEVEFPQPSAAAIGALLPRLPPATPVSADVLLPQGLTDAEYIRTFMQEFGGTLDAPMVFDDVMGEQLVIDQELFWDRTAGAFKVQKRGREVFIRLLARAIMEPDEIWLREELHGARRKTMVRRRYIARFEVEGQTTPVIGVFEWGPTGWSGITTYQAENEQAAKAMLDGYRIGRRVYVRQ